MVHRSYKRMSGLRAGLSLAELVIAMSITAVIGLSVAGVSVALTNAYSSTEDFYADLQTGRAAMAAVKKAVKNSKLVTSVAEDGVVLWSADRNDDGQINRDEVAVIMHDSGKGEIVKYDIAFPDRMNDRTKAAMNSTEELKNVVDLQKVLRDITRDPYARETVLATGVNSWSLKATPGPPYTKLVTLELTVGGYTSSIDLRSAFAIRADATLKIGTVHGDYVLITDGQSGSGSGHGGRH